MAVSWSGLFTTLGPLVYAVEQMDGYDGSLRDTKDTIFEKLDDSSITYDIAVNASFLSTRTWTQYHNTLKSRVVGLVPAVIAAYLQDGEGYYTSRRDYVMDRLWELMLRDSETIENNNVSVGTVTYLQEDGDSNTGNWSLVSTVYEPKGQAGDYTAEYIYTQDIRVVCTAGAEVNSEGRFEVLGEEYLGNQLVGELSAGGDKGWDRQGSIGSLSMLSESNSLLTDSSFENWTTNIPDSWDVDNGTGGTHFFDAGGSGYRNSHGLYVVSTAQVTLSQTLPTLESETTYVLTARMKKDAGTDAGTVTITPKSASHSFSATEKISLTADTLSTSYELKSVVFNTPLDVPEDIEIEIDVTPDTGITEVYIDDVFVQEIPRFRGLGLAAVIGSSEAERGDQATFTVTNDYSGKFQTFFGRFFHISLPSAASPTRADTLVTA